MKWSFAILLVVAISVRAEIAIGDAYQQVIAEKGAPAGKMEAGETMILRYVDQTIRLKAGKVVAIEAVKPSEAPAAHVAPSVLAATPKPTPEHDAPPAVELPWTEDLGAAMMTAKAQSRRVFIYFTGSDWSPWSVRMEREILSTPDFAAYAQANLVLVQVDSPKTRAQTPRQKRENLRLIKFYAIEHFPTVVVLDSAGQILARLDYAEGGPGAFIARLNAL